MISHVLFRSVIIIVVTRQSKQSNRNIFLVDLIPRNSHSIAFISVSDATITPEWRIFVQFLTLFLHVTCKWYLESGQRDNCASAVSVSRFPMMPPPNTSHVTKHCIGSYFKFHTTSAMTSDPSRNIECTFIWIVSDAVHDDDDVLSITLSVDTSFDLGEQLFQHWENKNNNLD